jgi:hypothetical protein
LNEMVDYIGSTRLGSSAKELSGGNQTSARKVS